MVDFDRLNRVADRFFKEGEKKIASFGNGLINKSFLLEVSGVKYCLQEINGKVFTDVPSVMDNIVKVTDHIGKKGYTIRPIVADDGKYYVYDGGYFRVMTYADGEVKEKITCADDMEVTGKGFGLFQSHLRDFEGELTETIPDFHNTPIRYDRLLQSARTSERRVDCADIIDEYLSHKGICGIVSNPLKRGAIPSRVTHNDTKINNIVVKGKEPVCAIDLDTVMEGSICYDFGDAIRSGGATVGEDGVDPKLNMEYFEAFCKGFFSADLGITEGEKRLLPLSSPLLTYECGMRFLTDYLQGDVYFGIKYEKHNLDRAKNQLQLFKDMLAKSDGMERIIDGFFS